MTRKQLHYLLVLVITLCTVLWNQYRVSSVATPSPETPVLIVDASDTASTSSRVSVTTTTNARVVRVVDGDTLVAVYDGKTDEVHVRLLGINTPESVDPRRTIQCFGKEASAYLRTLIEGKRVRLEDDPSADERDKYRRLLRNVITEDGKDVNALLVQEGYAYAYVSFPQNKQRKAQLKRLELEAKTAQRGLWNPTTCDGKK